jgi:ADP-heptose:LPS heptosyltransferase
MSERILIIFPGALGDLICLAPTIAAIARRHRGDELELMARGELADFAVGRLGIIRAHSIDRREVTLLFRESADDDDDQARRFFCVFERIYCFFSSDDPLFRRALTEASAPGVTTFHRFRPEGTGHVAAAYLADATGKDLLERIAINFMPSDLEGESRAISDIAEPKKFVAIFPGSGSAKKNWPIEKFSALADRLNEETQAVFILGPAENSSEDVLRDAGLIIIKNQPLGTVAALARMASVFVGNDSGVSHLAAATGTPGVVLFGPSDPDRWRPLGRVTVLHHNPIESIEVAEVLSAIAASGHRVQASKPHEIR